VLEQRLALELSEDIRGIDSGVDQIAENEVDNPVFPAEGDSRLGPIFGQRIKAGSLSAGKHHCENSTIHGPSRDVLFSTMTQTLVECQHQVLELHQISYKSQKRLVTCISHGVLPQGGAEGRG
jgi:pyoverdine/dityrosine biosynthesis protein Dit1